MDYTSLLVQLLPASVLPYLKALVTVLGAVASSVLVVYPGVDHRVVIASTVLTALATYLTPNVQPVKLVSTVAESAVPEAEYYQNPDTSSFPIPVKPEAAAVPSVEVPAAAPAVHEVGV